MMSSNENLKLRPVLIRVKQRFSHSMIKDNEIEMNFFSDLEIEKGQTLIIDFVNSGVNDKSMLIGDVVKMERECTAIYEFWYMYKVLLSVNSVT